VTDFISRVAARAVGQGASALPRRASAFEGAAAAGGFEVKEGETRAAVRSGPPPSPLAAGDASLPRPAAALDPQPVRSELEPPALPDHGLPPIAARTFALADRAEIRTVVPSAISPARPVVVPAEASLPPPAKAAAEQAPIVRVHIGRLEVRTSVQAGQPERQRPSDPGPPVHSLADYLRGKGS
jgi:hypothetical protein